MNSSAETWALKHQNVMKIGKVNISRSSCRACSDHYMCVDCLRAYNLKMKAKMLRKRLTNPESCDTVFKFNGTT